MKMKKIILSVGVSVAIIFFLSNGGWTQTKSEIKAPVITHAYVGDKGRYGEPLRVYIEADDPNGDMLRIATVVDHAGYGYYPTDWTYIKPQNQHHLIGYLQWNTFSATGARIHNWTNITIKVSVFDKAGNESNEVVFPFTFETIPGPQPNPPAPFDQGNIQKLGYIMIDLVNPGGERDRVMRIWPD